MSETFDKTKKNSEKNSQSNEWNTRRIYDSVAFLSVRCFSNESNWAYEKKQSRHNCLNYYYQSARVLHAALECACAFFSRLFVVCLDRLGNQHNLCWLTDTETAREKEKRQQSADITSFMRCVFFVKYKAEHGRTQTHTHTICRLLTRSLTRAM